MHIYIYICRIFLAILQHTILLSTVNNTQANQPVIQSARQSINQIFLFSAIPSILWPAVFRELLILLFTQFKVRIQCIHTLSAFEWSDLAFHIGPIFWSGSLSPSCQLSLKSHQSFLRKTVETVFLK